MTKFEEVRAIAATAKLYVDSYSPGDGVTRYRFMTTDVDYFATNGVFTALGIGDAMTFAVGAMTGYQQAKEES
jgi:hypothetical protein